MDKKAIETLSVNAVKNSIVASDFLDQFITENDKEPSWDGFVYIYGNKSKKKSNLKGRMPVQVKGKECNNHSKSEITYSMSIADLKNYLYDGGSVLFVVYIGENGLTNKIYYAELTPIKLRILLEEAKGKKTKSIQLKEFPTDNNRKATLFLNCLQNCQKQASFKEGKLLSLEELEEQGVLENIVISISSVDTKDPQMALIENEVYVYAKIKGSDIPHPLEMILQDCHTQEERAAMITVGGRLFYTKYKIVKSAEKVIIRYGESFTMSFYRKEKTYKFNYKNSDKIRVLAKDLDFMLSYLEAGYFKVNDVEMPLDKNVINNSNFDIIEQREQLKYIQKIVKVLDMLNCSEDINIKDLAAEDWRNLNRLITAFIEKKPVSGLKDDLQSIALLSVGKLKFAVYLHKCEDGQKGQYKIFDFFKTECSVAFDAGDGKLLPVSQFSILRAQEFLTISNMDFAVLLPSFQNVERHIETMNRANGFLLELLTAYDMSKGDRKDILLKTALDFCEWISEASEEELDYQVKTLNTLQTIRRKREFTFDELEELYTMVENKQTGEACLVGAYLLLGQQLAAEMHFTKLSEQEQKSFKEYPIYHFWLNRNGKDT